MLQYWGQGQTCHMLHLTLLVLLLCRDEELETAHFTRAEASNEISSLRQAAEQARVDAAEACQMRDRSVAALDGAKAEAAKAAANAERHQQVCHKGSVLCCVIN